MKFKELEAEFIDFCKALKLKIDQSHFDKDHKYITAKRGTYFLKGIDPRAGKGYAIYKNGVRGTVSNVTGYMSASELSFYMRGILKKGKI
jgi:hypothetical protein